MEVLPTSPPLPCRLLFSALDAAADVVVEAELARAGHFVVSNAKSHRMDPDVPLVVPEVNPDHLGLIAEQGFGEGAIATNPNCSTIGLVMALKPLADAFGLAEIHVVTMQALSGAGIPGVASLAALDNLHLGRRADLDEVKSALAGFSGAPQELALPTAPARPILVSDLPDRPQPRLDRGREQGMALTVGRLRPCPLLDYKFVALVP